MDARRLLALAVLVLALAPAATAYAQSLSEDDCRSNGGPRSFCVGAGKLGERASAECRRIGVVDDEQCWSRVGRRVVRSEVDAYEKSWLHRTLAFQSRLGDSVPFANAPWVGTHNSFNSTSEMPTASHTDSNQQLSLVDQLRLDVRSLELDVHSIPGRGVVVCHGEGQAGCTTERTLRERLAEVAAWLDKHPEEVLLLYLEDQLDAADYGTAAQDVLDTLGAKRLYRPTGGCRNLPLTLTRDAVRAAGAQVVVVGDCGSGAWQGISFAWPGSVRYEDRPHGWKPCDVPADASARIVRFYEDSTFVTAFAEPSGQSSTDDGLSPATVRGMIRCGVDLFGFDQLLPDDGRLAALAWSWDDGEPKAAAGSCTTTDGRWHATDCSEHHRVACRASDGTWSVPKPSVPRSGAAEVCADRGASFATPRTALEHAQLRAAAGDAPVWLSYRA